MKFLKKVLKKNKFLLFMHNCYKKRGDKDFIAIAEGNNPNLFMIRTNGDKNKDKIIYNIIIEGNPAGFFALYRFVLNALYVANRMKFTPHISIIKSLYNDDPEKTDNIFEEFFEQPYEISDEDIRKSYTVIDFSLSHLKWAEDEYNEKSDLVAGYIITEEYIDEMAEIRNRYIKYKQALEEKLNKQIEDLLQGDKALGVHYRGNAYNVGFNGHPRALVPEDYFEYIDECIRKGYTKIFVATDEVEALNKFRNHYGDMVCFYTDTERSDNGIDVHFKKNNMDNRGYNIGCQVIRDMMTLAKCDSLICGISQVTIAARIEKKANGSQYEYIKIIDKGFYEKDNEKKIAEYRRKQKL